MNCAWTFADNCATCDFSYRCPIFKEWKELMGISLKNAKMNQIIDLVKEVVGIINIVRNVDLKNKQNQEQLFEEISKLQDKLSELKQE